MVSPLTGARKAAHAARRFLRGETVVLLNSAGGTVAEIEDAIVTIDPPIVTRNSGPAERTGSVLLSDDYHANAVASHKIIVRDTTFDVLSVGIPYACEFKIQIGVSDQDHANLFDINDTQAVWSEA